MYIEQTLQQTKEKIGFGEHLDSSKDNMFVLGCNLGQKYSYLVRISSDNFKNDVLTIVQQKTDTARSAMFLSAR